MSPAANLDEKLLALQLKVSQARLLHEDICSRERTCRNMKLFASADALQEKADRAFDDLSVAKLNLATYTSKRQRGMK